MYYLKDNVSNIYNQSAIARKIGIANATMCRIFKKKQGCSKLLAYSITKAINKNAEIEEFFEIIKKGE